MVFSQPRFYTFDELASFARMASDRFKQERRSEESHWSRVYSKAFSEAEQAAAEVIRATQGLQDLSSLGALLGKGYLPIVRYMMRPSVSDDDLSNLTGVATRLPVALAKVSSSKAIAEYVARNVNTDIAPWLKTNTSPSAPDVVAACRAVAALMADQKTKTAMRGASSKKQERVVRETIVRECGFATRRGKDFDRLSDIPEPGVLFERETKVAGAKTDVVLGLYDGRFMALECKVSNTELNSVKRLNREAVEKVVKRRTAFGQNGVVPGVVLQGCFKASDLAKAQDDGAAIFWSLDLAPLVAFIKGTKA